MIKNNIKSFAVSAILLLLGACFAPALANDGFGTRFGGQDHAALSDGASDMGDFDPSMLNDIAPAAGGTLETDDNQMRAPHRIISVRPNAGGTQLTRETPSRIKRYYPY